MKNLIRLIAVILFAVFVSSPVLGEKPVPGVEKQDDKATEYTEDDFKVVQVSRMIKHLMRLAPGKKISRDAEYRGGMARDIVLVSDTVGVPLHLLTFLFYRESSYRTNAEGSKGELGIGQVMSPKKYGCDYSTRIGQMKCSAEYLRREYEKCRTWQGALSSYGSNNGTCRPKKGGTLEKVVRNRMRRWAKLRKAFPLPLDNTI